jgi:uncharacterized protein (DUF302 family)
MVIFETDYGFEEAMENVRMAIEARGMLVSGTLHVSDMLNRTGPDLGYDKVFAKAESVEFCSAVISHKMTQLSPENMSICPFTIALFVKESEPEQLYLAYRRIMLAGDEDGEVTAEIYELFNGIIQEAIE